MNLLDLFIKIAVDDQASGPISTLSDKLGNGLKAAAKVGMAAVSAAASGVVALTKASVDNYAEYEQLVGGVETLFKDSAYTVQRYAANAYKTAGMSANDYMATATSFSASLLQSLASASTEAAETVSTVSSEAAEDYYDEMKKALDKQEDAFSESVDKQVDAIKKANDEKLDALEKAHDKEISDFEKLTDEKIALIDKQYRENLKLIDKEEYDRLKAIDEQIDALNAQTELERAAIEEREQEQKIAALEEKVRDAETAEERKKARQDLSDYLADLAQKEVEAERKAQIEALKIQKDAIKEEADARREAEKEQYEGSKAALETASEEHLAALKELHEIEEKQLKESLDMGLENFKSSKKAELEALKESNAEKLEAQRDYIAQIKELEKQSVDAVSKQVEYTSETYALAAEYANMAITDMSDNANKMGTDIEMLQNAYSGFARGSYVMLDNLKLGYAGSQAEMKRLIADANAVKEANGEMADLSIESFADVIEAIHIMQVEMGISGITAEEAAEAVASGAMTEEEAFEAMGTTAKEAATTIEGSWASLKASLTNYLVSLADESQNSEEAFDKLKESVLVFAENVTPKILEVVESFGLLVPLVTGATTAFVAYKTAISISKIIDTLKKSTEGMTIAQAALNAMMKANPIALVVSLVVGLITTLVTFVATNDEAQEKIVAAWEKIKEVAVNVWGWLVKFITETVPKAFENFVDWLRDNIPEKFQEVGKNIINGIINGVKGAWNNLTGWFSKAWDKLVSDSEDDLKINSPSRVFADIGENMALGVGEGWGKAFDDISDDIGKSMDFERSLRINGDVSGGRTSGANSGIVPGVNVTQNIYASKMTPSEVMAEALYFQKKAVLFGV